MRITQHQKQEIIYTVINVIPDI